MYNHFKFIISFILISFFSISTFAQVIGEWTLRTPFKISTDIIEMHVTPDQTIHLLDKASYSGVLISENNGLSYKRATLSPSNDMHLLNDSILFVLRQDKLIKTTDRFATSAFILNGTGLECVFFLEDTLGFVGGTNGQLKKTIDGGSSWQTLTTGTTNTLKDVYFIDDTLGFACGVFGTFLRTTDGGTNWIDTIPVGANNYTHNKILFITPTQGVIVGVGGEIFYTNDAGLSWTQGTTNTIKQINDVKLISGDLMAVGHDGVVLKSTDLGQTWTIQILNSFKDNFSITETASEIYVGSEGGIYKSPDGTNWTYQGGVPWSDLENASFSNNYKGLIAGIGQTGSAVQIDVMLRTSDGGLNWENTSISNSGYRGVHMLPNGEALTAHFNINQVAYSSDFGENWSTINGPNITTQFITKAVWLKSQDDFFIGGGNYFPSKGIYRYQTSIGWTHDPSVGNVEKIQFLDNDFGVLCTIDNESFKTVDGGDSWQFVGSASGEINIIDTNIFYIGDYVTYDGGSNLQFNTVPMNSYKFFDVNNAIGVYNNGFVYQTVDAGVSWQVITTNGFPDANCCFNFYISESNVIAFGTNYNNSDIYTLSLGGVIPVSGTDTRTECDSLTWINGTTYTLSNNSDNFTYVGGAANGADSVVYLNLTIINSTTGTDTRTECDSLLWIDGNIYYANNNSATFNIVGGAANLCDSLVTLDLTIINSATGTDTRTECDSLLWIDGNIYYANNNSATFNIVGGAANLCDSLVTLDLTINTVNSLVTQAGTLLTTDEVGATYQWLDCPAMTQINGATSQAYTATANGDYAVIVTINGCSDTSACYTVTGVGIIENDFGSGLLLYPNPTDGDFSIDLGENSQLVTVTMTDLSGKVIQSKTYSNEQLLNLKIEEPEGVYLLVIESGDKKAVIRLVKE